MNLSKLENIIRQIVREELSDDELEEITTTGNVAGYNTPNAFKKTDGTDEDDETDDDFVDRINQSTGFKRVTENRWHELKKSEQTPNQKIGVGIRNVRKQLSEIEKFLRWYGKIKKENDMNSDQYWKRTQNHLEKIRERLSKIQNRISELR
jgi:succinate dehydrogenase/fumarate reductase flavoprotein subunit